MAKIENLSRLQAYLKKRAAKAKEDADVSVMVGYAGANYAVYVHENMEATHGEAFNTKHADEIAAGTKTARGPNQQAKFLEQPARELNNNGTFQRLLRQTVNNGGSIKDGLLLCGMLLQGESQKICPVDADSKTGGNLRGSAFTELEQGGVKTR